MDQQSSISIDQKKHDQSAVRVQVTPQAVDENVQAPISIPVSVPISKPVPVLVTSSFQFDPNRFRNLVHKRQSTRIPNFSSRTNSSHTSSTSSAAISNHQREFSTVTDSTPSLTSLSLLAKFKTISSSELNKRSTPHINVSTTTPTPTVSLTEMSKRIQKEQYRQQEQLLNKQEEQNNNNHHHHLSYQNSLLISSYSSSTPSYYSLQTLSTLSQKYNDENYNNIQTTELVRNNTKERKNVNYNLEECDHHEYEGTGTKKCNMDDIYSTSCNDSSFYHTVTDDDADNHDKNHNIDYDNDDIHSLGFISISSNHNKEKERNTSNNNIFISSSSSTKSLTLSSIHHSTCSSSSKKNSTKDVTISRSSQSSPLCGNDFLYQLGFIQQTIHVDNHDDDYDNDHHHLDDKSHHVQKDDSSTIMSSSLSNHSKMGIEFISTSRTTTTSTTTTNMVIQIVQWIVIIFSGTILIILLLLLLIPFTSNHKYHHPLFLLLSSKKNVLHEIYNYHTTLFYNLFKQQYQQQHNSLLQWGEEGRMTINYNIIEFVMGICFYIHECMTYVDNWVLQSKVYCYDYSGGGSEVITSNNTTTVLRTNVMINNWTPISLPPLSSGEMWTLDKYYDSWYNNAPPNSTKIQTKIGEEEVTSKSDQKMITSITDTTNENVQSNVCLLLLNGLKFKDWGFHTVSYMIDANSMYIIQSDKLCVVQRTRLFRKIKQIDPNIKVGYCKHDIEIMTMVQASQEDENIKRYDDISMSIPSESSYGADNDSDLQHHVKEESISIAFDETSTDNDGSELSQPMSNNMQEEMDIMCPSISQYLKFKDVAFKSFKCNIEDGKLIITVKILHPYQKRFIHKKLNHVKEKVIILEEEDYDVPSNNNYYIPILQGQNSVGWKTSQFWSSTRTSPLFVAKNRNEANSRFLVTDTFKTMHKESTPCFLSDLDPIHNFPGKPSKLYSKYPYPTIEQHAAARYMNEEVGDFQDFNLIETVIDFFNIWRKERQAKRKLKAQIINDSG